MRNHGISQFLNIQSSEVSTLYVSSLHPAPTSCMSLSQCSSSYSSISGATEYSSVSRLPPHIETKVESTLISFFICSFRTLIMRDKLYVDGLANDEDTTNLLSLHSPDFCFIFFLHLFTYHMNKLSKYFTFAHPMSREIKLVKQGLYTG